MTERHFLLQGPHGPFFWRLARMLRAAGSEVCRMGFNAGDRASWFGAPSFLAHRGAPDDWPPEAARLLDELRITDLVIYGDTRPVHSEAVAAAEAGEIIVHVVEGYLGPFWVTYERGGSNGGSRQMDLNVPEMRAALAQSDLDVLSPTARWGDMGSHVLYGALYHRFVLFLDRGYQAPHHRELPVVTEAWLDTRRLLLMPFIALGRPRSLQRALERERPWPSRKECPRWSAPRARGGG